MSGNHFGTLFRISTAGESHGEGYLVIVDGCPSRLPLSVELIQQDLDRRRPGKNRYLSQRKELDQVKILSGVYSGLTTGTPIALQIENHDQRSSDYKDYADLFRPGHGDYVYQKKYGHRDHRGGGRASARETVSWVAAGAIAKLVLTNFDIRIQAYLSQIGDLKIPCVDLDAVNQNNFFAADPNSIESIADLIETVRSAGDSIGSEVTVMATGVPVGLGEPVFDKLDARLASAMMGINAVKAVEIGAGKSVVTQRGSESRDLMSEKGFMSNLAGGVLAGISTGEPLCVRLSIKPTSSIPQPIETINTSGKSVQIRVTGRHDPCVGIRAVPIAEAMMALVLTDFCLLQQAKQPNWQCENDSRGKE